MLRLVVVLLLSFAAPSLQAARQPVILVFGDSLSSAYGLAQHTGWVDLLQQRIKEKRLSYQVVNASVSGETTSGGLARINDALRRHRPKIVIVELGGNDGLRGLSIGAMRTNLEQILGAIQKQQIRALLVGMKLPPNYGPKYTKEFEQSYQQIARNFKLPLVPFLFTGLGAGREYFQSDGVHPTERAQPIVLENVWRALAPMLE